MSQETSQTGQSNQQMKFLGSPSYGPNPELSRWMLTFEDTLEFIEEQLEGARYEKFIDTETGKKFYKLVRDESLRKLNKHGVAVVMDTLRGLMHRGNFLTDLTPQKVADHTETMHIKVASALLADCEKFEVKPEDVPRIVYGIVSVNLEGALLRSKNGKTLQKLTEMHLVHEQVQHQANQQRGPTLGIMSLLRGGGLGGSQ